MSAFTWQQTAIAILRSAGAASNAVALAAGASTASGLLNSSIASAASSAGLGAANAIFQSQQPAGLLFSDGFETGNFNAMQSGYGWNGIVKDAADSIIVSTETASEGTTSAKFLYTGGAPGDTANAGLEFIFGAPLSDVVVEWKQFFPTGSPGFFFDDFSGGNLSKQLAGSAFWADNSSGFQQPSATHLSTITVSGGAVRATYAGTTNINEDARPELRYDLKGQYPEIWVGFDVYVPANYYHRDAPGTDNNKFFIIYDYNNTYQQFMDLETWLLGSDGSDQFWLQRGYNGTNYGWLQPPTPVTLGAPADRGRWHHYVLHFKVSSAQTANDGMFQLWKNGVLSMDFQSLSNWAQGSNYFERGYIFGASNSGFTEDTELAMTNIVFSADPLPPEGYAAIGPRWYHRASSLPSNELLTLWNVADVPSRLVYGLNLTAPAAVAGDSLITAHGKSTASGGSLTFSSDASGITDARRGRWVPFKLRAKVASASNNDGIIQFWADDTLTINETALPLYPLSGTANYFLYGKFMGIMNSGFDQNSITFIDDVKISQTAPTGSGTVIAAGTGTALAIGQALIPAVAAAAGIASSVIAVSPQTISSVGDSAGTTILSAAIAASTSLADFAGAGVATASCVGVGALVNSAVASASGDCIVAARGKITGWVSAIGILNSWS